MRRSFLTLVLLISAFVAHSQSLFNTPNTTFINIPGEVITDLSFGSATINQIQSAINATRTTNPNNIIRITLTGNYTVSNLPLILSDKMLLFLNNATIDAANGATANSLISISNSQFISIVGIANGVLDGKNITGLKGIDITNSGKIHIDQITVKNCVLGGVYYIGKGATTFADAGSITRSNFQDCGNFGIKVNDSFNFICTDNTINNCVIGISTNSDNALISTNIITNCTAKALEIKGYLDVVSYNTLSNNTTAISIYNSDTNLSKSEALISYNTISSNGLAFAMNADYARIYYNNFISNTANISGTATAANNQFFCNTGLIAGNEGSVGSYFNPPTINNQHNNVIKTGKGRYELTINSTSNNSVSNIRTLIDQAISSNPNAVIVAHLNGSFLTSGSTDSLLVKDNVCVLLNGSISNGSGDAQSVVYFKDNNIVSSFSGGTIEGANTTNSTLGVNGRNALIYITGSANVILDHVIVNNSAGEGITKRNSTSPTFINACTVNNSVKRGIWQLASSRLFAFENSVNYSGKTGLNFDGFDLDAYSQSAVLVKNSSTNNTRYGVFIEEGASNHIVFDNALTANNRGISFYNLAVANKNSSRNLIAFNICRANVRGIHLDASASDRATIDNIVFNNTCENNTEYGINGFYNANNTSNNYCALNNVKNNTLGAYNTNRDYTLNINWNYLPNALTTLAIDFTHFNGKNSSAGNQLHWSVEATSPIRLFEIERSNNAIDFVTIHSKSVGETKINLKNFSFIDQHPFNDHNYYRLKAIDVDGIAFLSNTIVIKNIRSNLFEISYAFKQNNDLKFNVTSNVNVDVLEAKLFASSGKLITTQFFNMKGSRILDGAIPLPFFNPGTYLLTVKTAFGFATKKIMLTN